MRFLIVKALIGLLIVEVMGYGRNFSRIHRLVSRWRITSRFTSADTPERVCKAVNYACVWYPKRVLCLQRSAVTTCLLRTCGVPAKMVVGAQTFPFKAHAWTEVNGTVVNERGTLHRSCQIWERC